MYINTLWAELRIWSWLPLSGAQHQNDRQWVKIEIKQNLFKWEEKLFMVWVVKP